MGSNCGLGRSPGGGNGNPFQCSCLGNPMNRGAWQAIVHRVAESQTQLKRLSTHAQTVNHQAPLSMEFFQARNTRVGSHSFLQGIFPTQGSNLHLLHWQLDSYHWALPGKPRRVLGLGKYSINVSCDGIGGKAANLVAQKPLTLG